MGRTALQIRVALCDGLLCREHQGGEVIPVREADSLNRCKDSNPRAAGEEQLGTGSRDTVGPFDDHWQQWQTGVDRDAERPLLEWKKLFRVASGSFWEDDQRVSPFGSELDPVIDRSPARPTSLAVHFDDPNASHSDRDERDPKELLLCQEPTLYGKYPEQQRNVVGRKVIRNDHIPGLRVDVLEPLDVERDRRYAKERARPPLDDSSMERRGRTEHAVDDDYRRVDKGEHEEQRDQDKCSDSGGQGLEHAGSVDEMDKVTQ